MGRDESMNLSEHQVDAFQRDGFLILPSLFSPAEIEILREALVGPFAEDCPQNFRERGSGAVRTAMGLHLRSRIFARLALNLHVFLDDVTPFNGPLWFIPGSHLQGVPPAALDTSTSYPLWCVDRESVTRLIDDGGIVSATGPAGTVLIFGDCLVHGSPPNLSLWNRRIFSLILNPVANAYRREQRPDHQHHRDLTPVTALGDDCLREA